MDLIAKWNQLMREAPFAPTRTALLSAGEMTHALTQAYLARWYASERSLPDFPQQYSPTKQAENEKQLDKLIEGLSYELKHIPSDPKSRESWQQRLRGQGLDFARKTLRLEQRHLDFIETSGMQEALLEFARMARAFDAKIRAEDIYQAERNVMTMHFIQLLLGLPVRVTPSVFAYSMLYPYTDNYLDDPGISSTTKLAFNHRFRCRLQGETVAPANAHEAVISDLVGMIEGEWDRARYPFVYESLLAIHAGQGKSLGLVSPNASPYELDVLGISFEKGGASVLADGCLVAGWLEQEQASLLFGYGAFTQLLDDLEDVQEDLREGRMTVFSQTANHWPLDGVTNRLFHFGRSIFNDMDAFTSPSVQPLKELMERCVDPLLIDTIGRAGQFYNKNYLRALEQHFPYRIESLRRQRSKIQRKKISLESLVNTLIL